MNYPLEQIRNGEFSYSDEVLRGKSFIQIVEQFFWPAFAMDLHIQNHVRARING